MIRLAIAIASACAVVWYAGGNLPDWAPSEDARAAVERTARVAREEAARLLAAPSSPSGPATLEALPELEPGPRPEPAAAPMQPAAAPAAALEPLAEADRIPELTDFGSEVADAADAPETPPSAAERGWDEPLDSAQAEAVRCRLDRVMELASGAVQ